MRAVVEEELIQMALLAAAALVVVERAQYLAELVQTQRLIQEAGVVEVVVLVVAQVAQAVQVS